MKTDPILQEVLAEFEKELGFWFPNNVDALTLDGDARSMKERIRGCITSAVHRTREATVMPIELFEKLLRHGLEHNTDCLREKAQEVLSELEALKNTQV